MEALKALTDKFMNDKAGRSKVKGELKAAVTKLEGYEAEYVVLNCPFFGCSASSTDMLQPMHSCTPCSTERDARYCPCLLGLCLQLPCCIQSHVGIAATWKSSRLKGQISVTAGMGRTT